MTHRTPSDVALSVSNTVSYAGSPQFPSLLAKVCDLGYVQMPRELFIGPFLVTDDGYSLKSVLKCHY